MRTTLLFLCGMIVLAVGCTKPDTNPIPPEQRERTYTPEMISKMKSQDPETYQKMKAEGKVE